MLFSKENPIPGHSCDHTKGHSKLRVRTETVRIKLEGDLARFHGRRG